MRNNVMFGSETYVYIHNQTGNLGIVDKVYLSTGDMIFYLFSNKNHGLLLTHKEFNKMIKDNIIISMGKL